VTSPGHRPDCPGESRRRLPSVAAAGLWPCNGCIRCDGSWTASSGFVPRRSLELFEMIHDLGRAPLRNRIVDLLLTIGFRLASRPAITVNGQIRGSTSARLGQVQGGSRRMRPPRFLPTGHGGGAHFRPRYRPARSLFDTHCPRAGRACRSSPQRVQRRRLPTGR
jgi:hypothetical protein